jgi:CheY-like chemotaxis protein
MFVTSTDDICDGDLRLPSVSCEMPRVLIADDSRFQRTMLASYLMPKKCEVVFAVDAMQTFMMALRSSPNLILLDINMPGGTGIEVLKRLRVSNRTQQIPVIVISSEQNPATESVARELGAVDFLHKPIDEEMLANALDHVFGVHANIP